MKPDAITRLDQFTKVLSIPSEEGSGYRSYQVAGPGARFLAGFVDLLVQSLSFVAISWFAVTYRPNLFPPESWAWAVPVAFIEWHIIYLMLFESFTRGVTPGKRLCGIRVTMADGSIPGAIPLVVRNIARIADMLAGGYVASYVLVSISDTGQRLGDRFARTLVLYSMPLAEQLHKAEVPESIYSTSEDGYLLESWVDRERRFDADSRMASAIDLAVYLHAKYDPDAAELPDPSSYLRQLYQAEHSHEQPAPNPEHATTQDSTDKH